jgi:predicted nucleic-acid-binding protein
MLAIDTNVVVRYLTGDSPKEAAQARTLIGGNDVFVTITVLLETEWVLRSVFGHAAVTVAKSLRAFGGLPKVTIEGEAIVAQALDWFEGGMDFADALHLAQASACEAFVSFDRRLIRLAKTLNGPPARLP